MLDCCFINLFYNNVNLVTALNITFFEFNLIRKQNKL